jgi:hypothetical protein
MYILKTSGGQAEHDKVAVFHTKIIIQIKMKRIKTLGIIITLIIAFIGCEKVKDPAGQRNIAVIPTISEVNPGIFDSKDLENSFIEFKLTVENGAQAEKVVIEASYNNNSERVILGEVTSFPTTVRCISGDVIQKLGLAKADVSNGDIFTLELVTTAKGVITRSNSVLIIPVACAYDKALASGSYHSISADWNSEGDITISVDPDDPYTVYVSGLEEMEGLVEDKGPLVMHINPATFSVVAEKTEIASDAWGYGAISYSGTGVYSSCDGSYSMIFDISFSVAGDFGKFNFNFTRNP